VITIEPYSETWTAGVREFNSRLAAAGLTEFRFPETPEENRLPKKTGRRIFQEIFVAPDNGVVRGGYVLKHQRFHIGACVLPVAFYRLPLSEGVVNRAYASLGSHMVRNALKHQPLMFALGMGGFDRPLAQMLKAMKWTMWPVPFYFKVLRPKSFLLNLRLLRSTSLRRVASCAAAYSGAGWLLIKAAQYARAWNQMRTGSPSVQEFREFGEWADELWTQCEGEYAMAGERDSHILNVLYPADSGRFICLKVSRENEVLGWAVVLDTPMKADKYFGDLRVGTLADCFAAPHNAASVAAGAVQTLERRGVDLIVSNQGHQAWGRALQSLGFLQATSNFIFAASPKLAELLKPIEQNRSRVHLTRGDGDGPIHL
jgi:hypothetical protein